MILIVLLVSQHVDAIEIRLTDLMWSFRGALLQNYPTPGARFLRDVLRPDGGAFFRRFFVKPAPPYKLSTGAVIDDVAGNSQLHLFSKNPTCGGRRDRWREADFVPELSRLLCFFVGVIISHCL